MRTQFLIGTLLVGMTAVSGCVETTQNLDFAVNANEALSYQSALDQNADAYTSCLMANIAYRVSENISYENSDIIGLCSGYRSEFYKSSFYSAFGGYGQGNFSDEFRHNTARKDVSIVENTVFRRMSNEL